MHQNNLCKCNHDGFTADNQSACAWNLGCFQGNDDLCLATASGTGQHPCSQGMSAVAPPVVRACCPLSSIMIAVLDVVLQPATMQLYKPIVLSQQMWQQLLSLCCLFVGVLFSLVVCCCTMIKSLMVLCGGSDAWCQMLFKGLTQITGYAGGMLCACSA